MRESILGLDSQRSPQGIQAEKGIGAPDQIDAADGRLWYEFPVNRVTERLHDADSILIHRNPLRQPQQGRTCESTVLNIWLQRVILCGINVQTTEIAIHKICQIK